MLSVSQLYDIQLIVLTIYWSCMLSVSQRYDIQLLGLIGIVLSTPIIVCKARQIHLRFELSSEGTSRTFVEILSIYPFFNWPKSSISFFSFP